MNYQNMHCRSVGNLQKLDGPKIDVALSYLDEQWFPCFGNNGPKKIKRYFDFTSYGEAESFLRAIGKLSRQEGHYPFAFFDGKNAIVELQTSFPDTPSMRSTIKDLPPFGNSGLAIYGISENDLIMAEKLDELYREFVRKSPIVAIGGLAVSV